LTEDVAAALLRLAAARTPDEARRAYWQLDNHIVVQGTLTVAACEAVPHLLELLRDHSRFSRVALYDVLVEIALGHSPPDEVARDLRAACRDRIRAGLELVRGDLVAAGVDPAVRDRALYVLMAVEEHEARLLDTLRQVPETGDANIDQRVRAAIAGLTRS
jgi:hypothetical protein